MAAACGSRGDDREEARTPPSAQAPARASAPETGHWPPAHRRARRQPDGGPGPVDRRGVSGAAAAASHADGLDFEVVNAGVSGDTSAGGLSRLDWALEGDVRVLIVALGGNDALRGLPPDATAAQPRADHRAGAGARHHGHSRRDGSAAELRPRLHRRIPPGLSGARASSISVALVPFLLQGVAGNRGAEPARRHPSHGRRRAHRRGQGLDGARNRSPTAQSEDAPDHDRAARRLQDGHERQRAAHHPSSADAADSARASSSRSSGHRAAASRRCSA